MGSKRRAKKYKDDIAQSNFVINKSVIKKLKKTNELRARKVDRNSFKHRVENYSIDIDQLRSDIDVINIENSKNIKLVGNLSKDIAINSKPRVKKHTGAIKQQVFDIGTGIIENSKETNALHPRKTKRRSLKHRVEKYTNDINQQIFDTNYGVVRNLKRMGDLPEDISDLAAAEELYTHHAGRSPLKPDMITTEEQFEKVRNWMEKHPIQTGPEWSKDTKRDIQNLMIVNDIHKPEHKELQDILKGLTEAEARTIIYKATQDKNTMWVSETDLKTHKTGKHCEEEARNRIYEYLREMWGVNNISVNTNLWEF